MVGFGKRAAGPGAFGGQQEPAAKKKKESKTERILRQAREQAEADASGGSDAVVESEAHERRTQKEQHSEDQSQRLKTTREEAEKGEREKRKTHASATHTKSESKHEASVRAPPRHESQSSVQRSQSFGSEQRGRGDNNDRRVVAGAQAQEVGEGRKKKESKIERLKRQLAEQEGSGAENHEDTVGKGKTEGDDVEREEDGETIGGWAAAAEAEGLFDEGAGLMALASSKDRHVNKPVSGQQKQALLREVIPTWMKTPRDITATPETGVNGLGLDDRLVKALEAAGYSRFFPVQAAVVAQLLCLRPGGPVQWSGRRDVCVCAPTGSGKTLAFCVPIVQTLMNRVVPRLRALVVVPSRDLALQVHGVMAALCTCCDLRACLAAGQVPYTEERAAMLPHCDILVATPGRLTEHVLHTPNFTTRHLKFLVMDEADRLLSQSYQGWISTILTAATTENAPAHVHLSETGGFTFSGGGSSSVEGGSMRKLLFSATLTRNPSKLAPLQLADPVYFAAKDARYQTPKELKEFMVPLGIGEKPLALINLLDRHGHPPAICFTNSVAAAHRLYRLLGIYGLAVHLFSSELQQDARAEIVRGVASGAVKLVVCSDALSRGMDLPQVEIVVNYDVPTSIKTYVHRVGRTARAGREGLAYTLLQGYEVKPFKALLRLADNNYVRSVRVGERDLEPFVERYKMALKELRVVLDRERWRELDVLDAIEPLPHGEGGSAGLQVKSSNVELMRSAMRKRVQGAYGL